MRQWLARMLRRTKPVKVTAGGYSQPIRSSAGPYVTDELALTSAAYWRCVQVISGALAQCPWRVHQYVYGGSESAEYHPAYALLNFSPNSEMEAATWKELLLTQLLVHGNAYCEIDRDSSYRPVALWPLDASRVTPFRAENNSNDLWYLFRGDAGDNTILPAADVLHLRGMGNELVGYSVLRYAADSIGLALSQANSMGSTMQNGSRFSGIMSPPGNATVDPETLKALKEAFDARMTGSGKQGQVLWTNYGFEFKPLSMSNEDTELLESRRFSVVDICRFMGVPPTLCYELGRATWNNTEQLGIEFVRYTLAPWAAKIEQQLGRKLISPAQRRNTYVKIHLQGLMRGSMAERSTFYRELFSLGALSPNEIRELEDRNQIEHGDRYFVPANMMPLDPEVMPMPPVADEPDLDEDGPDDDPPSNGATNGRRFSL